MYQAGNVAVREHLPVYTRRIFESWELGTYQILKVPNSLKSEPSSWLVPLDTSFTAWPDSRGHCTPKLGADYPEKLGERQKGGNGGWGMLTLSFWASSFHRFSNMVGKKNLLSCSVSVRKGLHSASGCLTRWRSPGGPYLSLLNVWLGFCWNEA